MTRWSIDEPQEIELGDVQRVHVRVVSGHVDVLATDGPARLEVSRLTGPPLDVTVENGVLEITYDDLSWHGLLNWARRSRREVTLSLAVPRSCPTELGVVSASAVVAGIQGRTSVRSVSGNVTLDRLGDAIDAQTVSGDVEARGLNGELRFKTVSGDLTVVEGVSGSVQAKTVSGDVTVDVDLAARGKMEIGSVSGDVTVRLPENTGARVDFRTNSGDLGSAFEGLSRDRTPGRAKLGGTIGTGDGKVSAKTVSGDVALLRRTGGSVPA